VGDSGSFWKAHEWVAVCLSVYLSIYLSISLSLCMYICIYLGIPNPKKNGKVNQLSFDLFGITMCMYCMYVWVAGI
jgi:hypothetical protein